MILTWAICCLCGWSLRATPQRAITPSNPYVDAGGCPFEGCQYGKWVATEAVTLYGIVGGKPLQRRLKPKEAVTAMTGEVHSTPRKATVTRVYKSDEAQGIHVGSVIYTMYPIGEGAIRLWHEGAAKSGSLDLQFKSESAEPLQWTWWAKVRMTDGTTAWVKDPLGSFTGMGRFGG